MFPNGPVAGGDHHGTENNNNQADHHKIDFSPKT
jgi:hypothetical protein